VPLIAVHMFVFYFGILADDTPPVGLAAFAAAAISGGDPIKTGLQGFAYDIRTALLPFLFIFNTELLLIDVSVAKAFFVFGIAVIAMMLFASATQGYLFVRNKIWESALLLVVAFALFRPAFFLDYIVPPFEIHPATEIMNVVDDTPARHDIMLSISGPDFDTGEVATTTILVPLAAGADAATRLADAGLNVNIDNGKAVIEEPFPGTPYFETLGKAFDYYGDEPVQVAEVRMEAKRIFKEIIYLPAILVLGLVVFMQKRRQREQQGGTAEATA